MDLVYKCKRLVLIMAAFLLVTTVNAQSHLNKKVSLNANRQKLGDVLKNIEQQGSFYFSYPNHTIRTDSIISITVQNQTVRQTLDRLFEGSLEYDETEKHLILRRSAQQIWYASGYVYDQITGEKISNASVYERKQLASTMTNEEGFYRLKLKDRSQAANISISKAWYIDTTITIKPSSERELTVSIVPKEMVLDTIVINSSNVEDSWLGRFFLSSRQRMQSLNMSKFFVNIPVQASITPGLGTHGKMSAQIVNKFSFNLLGGYTAGLNGMELGGIFNIVKKDAQYTQIAGAFNAVGDDVTGLQIAGAYNHVMDSAAGAQIAGFGNTVLGSSEGVQVSGFFNLVKGNADGTQVTGFANVTRKEMKGVQISGFANIAAAEMDGIQIAGFINYTKKMNGVQIGFINYADTSNGFGIAFLNIVKTGYHKLSISTNEVTNLNAAFKAGNKHYYSIISFSMNAGDKKAYSYGYGIGTEINFNNWLSLTPEVSAQQLYLGSWNTANILSKISINLTYKPTKYFSVFAGPSYSIYYSNQTVTYSDYKNIVPTNNTDWFGTKASGWIGWNAGINIF